MRKVSAILRRAELVRLGIHSLIACLAIHAMGCAHSVVITSDPPGLPVFVNGTPAGVTPARIIESKPYALNVIEVGEGEQSAARIVPADRAFARPGLSAIMIPISWLVLPVWPTAGMPDRVHLALAISGDELGGGMVDPPFDLEYLSADTSFPAGTEIGTAVVGGEKVRYIAEQRKFAFSLNLLGIDFRRRVFGSETHLAAGAEFEWLPLPRLGLGTGISRAAGSGYLDSEMRLVKTGVGKQTHLRDWRTGIFARYRQPMLRWDGVTGGLDGTVALGAELAYQSLTGEWNLKRTLLVPYAEAGLDAQITIPLVLFSSLRYFPQFATESRVRLTPNARFAMGLRLLF